MSHKLDFAWLHGILHCGTTDMERWYMSARLVGGATSSIALTQDRLYAIPLPIVRDGVIDAIGVRRFTGAGDVRIGIYRSTSVRNLYPSALVYGSAALVGTGVHTITGLSLAQSRNEVLWMAILASASTAQVDHVAAAACWSALGTDNVLSPNPDNYLYVAQTYGALPDPFPSSAGALFSNQPAPAILLRYSQ